MSVLMRMCLATALVAASATPVCGPKCAALPVRVLLMPMLLLPFFWFPSHSQAQRKILSVMSRPTLFPTNPHYIATPHIAVTTAAMTATPQSPQHWRHRHCHRCQHTSDDHCHCYLRRRHCHHHDAHQGPTMLPLAMI